MPRITYPLFDFKPIATVRIGVSEPWQQFLTDEGTAIPEPVQVAAIIDTGASHTCVDPFVIEKLGISPRATTLVGTASTGATLEARDEYDLSLSVMGSGHAFYFEAVHAIATDLKNHGFHALIGRDILKNCLFVYDGEIGIFSLSL